MCSMIHTGLRPAANTDVTHKRSEVTIVSGAYFLTQMIFSYLDLFSSVFILSLYYFLKDPLYSGSLSFLFLVFLNHRHEADPGQNNDQDAQYHQIDIPVSDLGQLDAQRILVGKEEVRPEIDVLQFTVEIGR